MDGVEEAARAAAGAGEHARAAEILVRAYGPEVLGWLVAITSDAAEADDALAAASEDALRGMPSFRWECTGRAWLYTLARHALLRQRRAAAARPHRREALGDHDLAAASRSATAPWLRTDVKDAFAALRATLEDDERALLVLRVDRDLSWDEIATILEEEGDRAKAAARLRKRFQIVKDKLRERASALGVLGGRG